MKQTWSGAAKLAVTLVAGLLAGTQIAIAQTDPPKIIPDAQYYVLYGVEGA